MVCIPATLIGVIVGAIAVRFMGVPLEKDPEYLRRLKEGLLEKKITLLGKKMRKINKEQKPQ